MKELIPGYLCEHPAIVHSRTWNNKISTIDYLLDTELNSDIRYTQTTDQTNSYNYYFLLVYF